VEATKAHDQEKGEQVAFDKSVPAGYFIITRRAAGQTKAFTFLSGSLPGLAGSPSLFTSSGQSARNRYPTRLNCWESLSPDQNGGMVFNFPKSPRRCCVPNFGSPTYASTWLMLGANFALGRHQAIVDVFAPAPTGASV
jgi:hypothetical protein